VDPSKLKQISSANRSVVLIQAIVLIASVWGIAAGILSFIGSWLAITGIYNGSLASQFISPGTAISFVLSGVALLLLNKPDSGRAALKSAVLLAVLILTFATAQLVFSITHGMWYDCLANLLVGYSRIPVPIAIQTLASIVLLASGILLTASDKPKNHFAAQLLAIPILLVSTAAIIGYTYGFAFLKSTGLPTDISFTSAGVLSVLATALLFSRPNVGPIAIFTSDTLGGSVARRSIPLYFVIPLLGLLTASTRNTVNDLLFIVLFAAFGLPVFVWLVAHALERSENEKMAAYDQVQVLNQQLNKQVDELVNSQSQITEALKARSEFLAKVSHELRTPLSGVIGTTELLLCTPLTSEQLELATISLDSANSLLTLINEILDFSKIDARKLHLEKIDFDLNQLLETAIQTLRAKAEKKGLVLVSFQSADVPARVNGDPGRLRQIVVNLIDNAIKFTDQGKILLHVCLEENAQQIRFAITDTGIGIAEEQNAKLFHPFVQADGSTTRRYGGTGLGLSICKNLVDLMGGKIGIHSTPGKGSTFWFTVPMEKSSEPNVAEVVQERPRITTTAKLNWVLLVEDNPVNARLALLQLKRLGYLADTASTGREAVQAVKQKQYSLILMDIQMPDIDGYEATHLIRKMELRSGLHVPIVATTAHAMPADRDKCLNAGMDDYMTKPLSLAMLAAKCKEWIASSETAPTPIKALTVIPFQKRRM